jgi:hypothetical protein
MPHQTFAKPLRGSFLLERRERKAELKAHEQREMQAAKKRDGGVCRWPGCRYAKRKDIPVDACHMTHRGAGGNPDGSRTTRASIWTACRIHHGLYDAARIDVQPMTTAGTDGPLMFLEQSESGRMECVAVEKSHGISETRGV